MTYARGALFVLLAATLWSTMGLLIRLLAEAGVWATLFWRSVGLVPVLMLWLAVTTGGRPLAAIRAAGRAGAIGGAGLVAAFAGAIYAIQTTSVANAVFLFAVSPMLTALLGWAVLGERIGRHTWAAMALALAGMAVMVREGLSLGHAAGNAAAILSAAGFATFTVCLRAGRVTDMLPAVVAGGLLSAGASLAVLAATGGALMVPPSDIAVALTMGAVLLGTGMVLYTAGSRVLPAVDATLLSLAEVVLAPLWVFLILGETATPATLLGGAVVIAALVLNARAGAQGRAAAARRGLAGPAAPGQGGAGT